MTIEFSAESQIEAKREGRASFGYETPQFECHDLRLITLGGASGADDSGNAQFQAPLEGGNSYDEEFEPDTDW